MMRVLCF